MTRQERAVIRAAREIAKCFADESVAQARQTHANIKGVGGQHYISNGRLLRLIDAVADYERGGFGG